ncbi:MAG: hypothetical protein H7Y00_01065 [Fimbriimonadaceae bacterium]|nr:hypothetical protein [Chitinophagales bacterium]
MRFSILCIVILIKTSFSMAQITELYKHNQTPTYFQVIDYFTQLASKNEMAKMIECGKTDSGYPLHLFVIDKDKDFDPANAREKGKSILLIDNGIHPGEPDGIDACIKITDEILNKKSKDYNLDNLVICIIPVYNIDGALNRNSTSRVNQEGPESFGFRGNAQNYDLNRDFIKCDALNAQSFTEIFRTWDPDIFVDTHVSNGADYQYVMTLISTQHNRLTPPLGDYLQKTLSPHLYAEMEKVGFPMCPYVDEVDKIPDNGILEFMDYGRYSTGYTTTFNTIGFMPETHMLKPYDERVESTYALLKIFINYVNDHAKEIIDVRNEAKKITMNSEEFPIEWKLDMNNKSEFSFKGYEAKYKPSEVSGLQRLYYDRNKPFEKNIPFYNNYTVSKIISAPKAYIIPSAWRNVIERLKLNKVQMHEIEKDTAMEVEVYYIEKFKSVENPFEGHYLHNDVELRKEKQTISFRKGDYIVYVNQEANRYIVETLEPEAPDSFFAWNFFDAILMQKEWFSDYVFEDIAAEVLKENPQIKTELENKKTSDPEFAKDARAQLTFVYQHSKYYEPSHNRYPVYRLTSNP